MRSTITRSAALAVLLAFAASKHLVTAGRPLLYADSGIENVNSEVDSDYL